MRLVVVVMYVMLTHTTTPILMTRIETYLDITLHIHPAYNRNYLSLMSTLT